MIQNLFEKGVYKIMKIMHLADLHIGKRVNEFSMIEDQRYILRQILRCIDETKPKVIMIAGDVYDKSIPTAEAVELLDYFLEQLLSRDLIVLMIYGNHDSPERLSFGANIFDKCNLHISPIYDGEIKKVEVEDEYGPVEFYLLPFIKPAHVRNVFDTKQDEEICSVEQGGSVGSKEKIESYTDAMKVALSKIDLDETKRNILITHQFVTGALRAESEDISVGGSDNVDISVFEAFDYVALGHIHRAQQVGSENICYCGTPLKYSFSEANHKKILKVIEIKNKGVEIVHETIELTPLRDMREIKGSYMELTNQAYYQDTNTEDYLHITLTDEEDVVNALAKLRVIYPNIMKLDYDNKRTRSNQQLELVEYVESKSPMELFRGFFETQNNQPLNIEQEEYIRQTVTKIWGDI